jgi:hypothetical protein
MLQSGDLSMRKLISIAMLVTAGLVINAADAAYFGTWKFVPAKSDLGPVDMVVTRSGDEFQLTDAGKKSYKFRIDGKGYTDPYGATVTWKQLKDNEWTATYVMDGKTLTTEHYLLSADGRTLTSRNTFQTDRGPTDQTVTLTRNGTGTGLVGTWTGKVQLSPFVLEIVPQTNDGLIFRIPGVFESHGKFDGKPNPMTGPMAQKESTASFIRIDSRSFKTKQVDPSLTLEATISVSADGKTLTEVGKTSTGTTRTWVFERQ